MQNTTTSPPFEAVAASFDPSLRDLAHSLRDVFLELRRSGPADARDKAAVGLLAHLIEMGPTRLGDLAEHACLSPSTVSRHVKELEDAGYLLRARETDDKRATVLEVSPAGQVLVEATVAHKLEVLSRAVESWSADDTSTMTTMLRRLADSLAQR
ncbi:MAG: MarR family transcriptional regulator [Candidatus Nanopelagicales bacterium]